VTLSLLLLLAAAPLNARLPAVDVGTTHYERAQLVAALYAFSGGPRPGVSEPTRAIVLLWDDGRVLWSDDAIAGGPPYRTGFVTPARAAAVAERFKNTDPAMLTRESLGPDAQFATLYLRLGGGRLGLMKSWHPREPNTDTIATSRGLEARNGRDPAAVLAADTADYQAFRRTWRELEEELLAVAHAVSAPRAVSAKLDWDWLIPARFELKLERVKDTWRFAVGEATFATVAELRHFVEQQKRGTVLTWDPGCKRLGDEPLLSSDKDLAAFKAFCTAHGVELDLRPGG
jgi:hypothetical protein